MKLYRFSPIKSEAELLSAITYIHVECSKLCNRAFGQYLPIGGNVGIFCHYDEEFGYLTKLRKERTIESENFNNKYFRLHTPIIIPAQGDIPGATYDYLYIRQPDPYRSQVGDVDFVLALEKYRAAKQALVGGKKILCARVYDGADLDMIELHDPDVDVLGYIVTTSMQEEIAKIGK
jgi:hypothetical protein